MLKTKVKVGSVTNLSEARYCSGMGVDFLSFPVSIVDPKTYQEITGWVAGPKFGIETDAYSEKLAEYAADFVQTNIESLSQVQQNMIVTLPCNRWAREKDKLIASKNKILFLEFTLTALDPETSSVIREACSEFEIFIKFSGNHSLEQLLELPIAGISLEGSAEVRAGLKEYPLAEVLEKLEVE